MADHTRGARWRHTRPDDGPAQVHHIQVVYAPNEKQAHRACRVKAAMLAELGLEVHLCGNVRIE